MSGWRSGKKKGRILSVIFIDMAKYDAFISYSHADCGTIAPLIQKGIQTIGRPWYKLSRNLNVFRDETNLAASPHLWATIEEALKNASHFILFASPIAATSKWVADEVDVWLKNKDLDTLFIVLTDGDIEWDDSKKDFNWDKTNCLPNGLAGKFAEVPTWIDLKPYVKQSEKGKELDISAAGFTTAMTKIIGGITGVDPWRIESDELKSQRNARRIRTLVTLVFLVLSVVIFIEYQDADRQKVKAVKAEQTARQAEHKAVLQKDTAMNNLKKFKIAEFKDNLSRGKTFLDAKLYCIAKPIYLSADSTARNPYFMQAPEIAAKKDEVEAALKECLDKCKN